MKKRLYDVEGLEEKAVVYETKRQKDILEVLDEMIENATQYGWDYIFSDSSFTIEYTDGKTYEANACGEYGVYRKNRIARIIYANENDTWVYGQYEVNEYGCVS